MINVAILGPGGIADDQHAPAVEGHSKTRLWSVLSRSHERAVQFAAKHHLASPFPAHTSLDVLLQDPEVHAVIIATPDRLHAEQVIACAKAKKHILLEKPMATSLEECDKMTEAARQNNVVLALAYHLRWHAGHRKVKSIIQSGGLGKLRHCRAHWTFAAPDSSNWRSAPASGRWWSLAANGTHCLDLVRWLFTATEGEVVDVKTVVSRSKFNSPHDETAIVALQFESGATAEICVSVQFASESRLEVYGDAGSIRMEGTMGRHGKGEIFQSNSTIQPSIGPNQPFLVDFEPTNPFIGELNDFVEAIETGRQPEVSPMEGRRNVELLLQAIQASGVDRYGSLIFSEPKTRLPRL